NEFLEITKKYLSPELKQILYHPAVKIINTDGRYFLKTTKEKFDSIIINLPESSTLSLNRFYTKEFFIELKKVLAPGGIISIHLPYSPNYLNEELKNLNASLYKTLTENFFYTIFLPEETNFFISSLETPLSYEPEKLIQKFKERKIKTSYLNEDYIRYRLTNERVAEAKSFLTENSKIKINKDLEPATYYYNFIYWLSYFYPWLSKFFSTLAKMRFWQLVLISAILGIFLHFFIRKKFFSRKVFILAMGTAGFSLMAIEIILLVSYQIFLGYLYYRLAFLLAVLMAGMALGTYLANSHSKFDFLFWQNAQNFQGRRIKTIQKIHLAIGTYSLFLIGAVYLTKTEFLFFFAAAIIGFFAGLEFPLLNKLYLENEENPDKSIGIIYSADLFGSCLGAFFPALFLIPIFGIVQTLLFLAIINFFVVLFIQHLGLKNF
ncbi:MAG: hypothetical protein ACPLZH_02920, partial [Minisyncoccales bacterium]